MNEIGNVRIHRKNNEKNLVLSRFPALFQTRFEGAYGVNEQEFLQLHVSKASTKISFQENTCPFFFLFFFDER